MLQDDEKALAHGQFLEEHRLDKGLKWSEVAKDMDRLYGVSVTADYLSKIKRGRAHLAKASLDVREALRGVLGISAEEWERETGLYTGKRHVENLSKHARTGVFQRVVKDMQERNAAYPKRPDDFEPPAFRVSSTSDTYEEPEIDDALQEAVRRYGNVAEFAGIKSHNLQRALNDIDFRRRPQTPEEWLAKYLKFKDELPDGEADA